MPDVQEGDKAVPESTEEKTDRIHLELRPARRWVNGSPDEIRYRNALDELAFYRTALAAIILESADRVLSFGDDTKHSTAATRGTIVKAYDHVSKRTILRVQSEGKIVE